MSRPIPLMGTVYVQTHTLKGDRNGQKHTLSYVHHDLQGVSPPLQDMAMLLTDSPPKQRLGFISTESL